MMNETISPELNELITGDQPLRRVASRLREFRDRGLTRIEARQIFEALRGRAADEAQEDRILEVLDIVAGFCSPELTVWD